jgi:hypothetical protein
VIGVSAGPDILEARDKTYNGGPLIILIITHNYSAYIYIVNKYLCIFENIVYIKYKVTKI